MDIEVVGSLSGREPKKKKFEEEEAKRERGERRGIVHRLEN